MKTSKSITLGIMLLLLLCCTGLALAEPIHFDVASANVSYSGGPFVYQGTPITPSVSLTFGGTHTADASGYSVSFSDNLYTGTGMIHITGNGAVINDPVLGDVTYTGTTEKSFTIEKAKVTVNFPLTDPGLVYNGQAQGINWSVSGEVTPGDAQAYITYYGLDTPPIRATNYLATVCLNNWNYEIMGTSSYSFAISRKPVTVSFPEGTYTRVVYDGTVRTIPWSISGEITPGDASAQVTYYAYSGTSLPPKDTGSYSATVSVDAWKYEISGDKSHDLIIDNRPLTVVFSSEQHFTYNMQMQMPDWHLDGLADGENPVALLTLTGTSPEPVNTGVYTMTVNLTGADVNKNYILVGEKERVYFINRAPVTFTFPTNDPEYMYNAQSQTIPWGVSDPVAGEDPVVGVHYYMDGTGTPTVSAGMHTAVAYLDFSNPINQNYEVSGPFFFTYTIAQAPVTVTFPSSDPGYTYNGQVQTIPWSIHDPVTEEDPNYQMYYYQYGTMAQPRNAGPYTIYFYMPYDSVNVNYKLISEDRFDFFIHQKTLMVTPVAKEKLLGTSGPEPVFEYTVSGQVGSDVPIFDGELYCDWEEAPGEYEIYPGYLWLIYYEPVNVNYSMDFQFTQGISYTVKALEGAPDAVITPAVPDGKNGWYNTTAVITPPQGYTISWVQQADESAWHSSLDREDGMYGPQTYYLRRISDGAITSAKQLPAFNQDQNNPTISSAVVYAEKDGAPCLMITGKDNVQLQKIVVFDGGKPVRTQSLLSKELDEYTILHRFVKPGSYNAMAYDAAGNVSLHTAAVTVADTDGDGLSDAWETWQGTDPNSLDSDGDGIDDYTTYQMGVTPGGSLPAAAALLLGAQGQSAAGDGLSKEFLSSSLVSDLQDMRTEDISLALMLNGSAVIVQLDLKKGSGWAIDGSRLVHFIQGKDGFVCDEAFMLQASFGVLKQVIFSSGDGSVMLQAHYNENTGWAEGTLKILDTKAKKVAVLSGSEGATAFDLSQDGSRAVYTVGGRTRMIYLQTGLSQDLHVDAFVTMFTPDGRLAFGAQDSQVLFLHKDGSVSPEAYDGFVDAAQRTNTSRRISVPLPGGETVVDVRGILTFSDDGKGIVYVGMNGITEVLKAGEV